MASISEDQFRVENRSQKPILYHFSTSAMDFYFQAVSASCLRMTPYRRTPCGLQPTAPHVRARKGIPGSCLAGASHCDPSPFSSTARPGHGPAWRTPGPTSRPPEPVLRARSRRPARCGTPLGTSVRASFRLLQQLRKQLGEKPRPSRETPPLSQTPPLSRAGHVWAELSLTLPVRASGRESSAARASSHCASPRRLPGGAGRATVEGKGPGRGGEAAATAPPHSHPEVPASQ